LDKIRSLPSGEIISVTKFLMKFLPRFMSQPIYARPEFNIDPKKRPASARQSLEKGERQNGISYLLFIG
jgi:hypothetical protein